MVALCLLIVGKTVTFYVFLIKKSKWILVRYWNSSWQGYKMWCSVQLDVLTFAYLSVLENTVIKLCVLVIATCPCPGLFSQSDRFD